MAFIPPQPLNAKTETLRSVFLPKEHGSWSLLLEPLALGILVVPSVAGGALALAAVAAFFSRRPLMSALNRGAKPQLSAIGAVGLLGLLSVVGLGIAAILGGMKTLWPLLLSCLLGVPFLLHDLKKDARSARAEVLGGASFAVLPAAFATLSGWRPQPALALAAVMVARTVPTLLFVRYAVRAGKGQQSSRGVPSAAAVVAFLLLVGLAAMALVPWIAALLALLLIARSIMLTAPRQRKPSARWIGTTEAALGVLYVVAAATGYLCWRTTP
jgi:hypothetical protein